MSDLNNTKELQGGRTADTKFNFGKKGWLVVICGLLAFTVYMSFDNALNWIAPAFSEKLNVTQTSLMLFTTIGGWVSVVCIAVFGALQKKIGCKKVMISTMVAFLVGAIIWALAGNLAMYGIGAIVTKSMGCVFTMLCFAEIGSNWFPTKKGNYMGVITIGVVVSGFLANGPIGTIIRNSGPKAGIMVLTVLGLIVLVLSCLFIKNFPEEAGANPDNDKDMTPEQAKEILNTVKEFQRTSKWTASVCIRNKTVWLVGIAFGLLLCAAQGLMAQTVPAALSYGHSENIAQIMSISIAPFALVATIVTGKLDQKWGTKKIAIIIFIVGFISCLIGVVLGKTMLLMVCFWLVAAAVSGGNNLLMSFVSTIWGRVDFSMPYTVALTISQIIAAFGYIAISSLASLSQTYVFAFVGGAVIIFIGLVMVLCLKDDFLGRSKNDVVEKALGE